MLAFLSYHEHDCARCSDVFISSWFISAPGTCSLNLTDQPGMVVHTFKPSPWQAEAVALCDFEAILVYMVSLKPATATQ